MGLRATLLVGQSLCLVGWPLPNVKKLPKVAFKGFSFRVLIHYPLKPQKRLTGRFYSLICTKYR